MVRKVVVRVKVKSGAKQGKDEVLEHGTRCSTRIKGSKIISSFHVPIHKLRICHVNFV